MSAQVAEKSTRRGRPSGKAQVGQEAGLRLHDLSFVRAVVQGLAPAAAAQRYLPELLVDERVARTHLRHLVRSAAAVLEGMCEPVAAQTVLAWLDVQIAGSTRPDVTTAGSVGETLPSLDEFAEEIGAEDFNEREIQELYQERYGALMAVLPAPAATAAAAVKLDAVLRALSIVQSRGVVLPKAADPVRLWFSQTVTTRLVDAQIVLLQDLVQYVNRHGRHWYKHVPGVGQDRARRLVGWLVQHEPFLDLKLAPRSRWDSVGGHGQVGTESRTVCFSTPSSDAGQGLVAQFGAAAQADVPGSTREGRDSLRSLGPNALGVQSDLDAVKAWLETLSFKSQHTRTAYARDVQRLLIWAHERDKTLSTLTVTDATDHARFLVDPPAHWLCELPTRRADPGWRPMRGPLSDASAARALAAIGHLYGFLVETGFLVANPFSRIRRSSVRGKTPQIDTTRSFGSHHLQMLVNVVQAMPAGPARRRAQALLMLMTSTGVRIGELGGTWGDVVPTQNDWKDGGEAKEAQCLRVIGKGGKERFLPMKPSVLKVLQAHLDDRRALEQQGVLPRLELSLTPLISVVAKPVGLDRSKDNGGLSAAGIHRVIKALCERAARECTDARLAAEFRAASAHWMRHTFAHAVLRASGGDLPVTQQLLGHASIATTGIYVKADTYRDREGWQARSEVNVSATRVLKLTTSKVISGTGLRTSATVWNADAGGMLRHAMAFGGPSGDFSETVAFSKPARVTEAIVTAQHQAALAQLSRVLVAIERHYAQGKTASETVAAELDQTGATPV